MTEFKKHLVYKVITNFIKIPVNLILNAIFPRLLGPTAYGNFDFLQDSASKIIGFFDTGSSIAFYTRLSHNYTDRKLIRFYWYVIAALTLIYMLFVFVTKAFGFSESVWPQQDFLMIVLSTILGIVTFISSTLILITDAADLTVNTEKVRMIHMVISMLIYGIVILLFQKADLSTFFLIQIFLVCLLISGTYLVLYSSQIKLFSKEALSIADIKKYGEYFLTFSSPLLVYSLVGLVTGIGARWILQQYGGSIQQAYFGLSARIGGFVLLFSSALMPLIIREFARFFSQKNYEGLLKLYIMSYKGLYIISMFIAVFVFFNVEIITKFLGGTGFHEASSVLAIMAFFPVHQSLGQINGSFFYSTNRNRHQKNIGLVFMPLSVIFSFFFIAPAEYGGLNMGAKGLAFQMLIIQLLTVNVSSFINSRFLGERYLPLMFYQIIIFVLFYSLGFICNMICIEVSQTSYLRLVLFLILFSIFTATLIFIYPSLAGFKSRQELLDLNPLKKR